MAILPQKPQELGRIRSGDQVQWEKNGKKGTRPHKLECFRLTSQIKPRLDYAAQLPAYGGEVSAWKDAPGGEQWQLYTAQPSIPVMVPPFNALSQNNEMWQGNECTRRCNGCTIVAGRDPELVGKGCLCQSMGIDERLEKAKLSKPEACSTITRLSLVLPDLPGVGIWLYSTKSYYAGMELQGNADMLQTASQEGMFISAMLSIEERRVVRGGKTKIFPVVTLQAEVTMRQLLTRELPEDKHIRIAAPAAQLAAAPHEDVESNDHRLSPEVSKDITPYDTGHTATAEKATEHITDIHGDRDAADTARTAGTRVVPGMERPPRKNVDNFRTKLVNHVLVQAGEAGISVASLWQEMGGKYPANFELNKMTSVMFEAAYELAQDAAEVLKAEKASRDAFEASEVAESVSDGTVEHHEAGESAGGER